MPTEYTYLDDEPQEIKPLNLEVPILHMAIIDVRLIEFFVTSFRSFYLNKTIGTDLNKHRIVLF